METRHIIKELPHKACIRYIIQTTSEQHSMTVVTAREVRDILRDAGFTESLINSHCNAIDTYISHGNP